MKKIGTYWVLKSVANINMRDKSIKEKARMTFIDHTFLLVSIQYIYNKTEVLISLDVH